ncbi:hypothetical protein ACXR2W_13090 [Leucobacter sp. HY1908]
MSNNNPFPPNQDENTGREKPEDPRREERDPEFDAPTDPDSKPEVEPDGDMPQS